jgi:hypothetical protein
VTVAKSAFPRKALLGISVRSGGITIDVNAEPSKTEVPSCVTESGNEMLVRLEVAANALDPIVVRPLFDANVTTETEDDSNAR